MTMKKVKSENIQWLSNQQACGVRRKAMAMAMAAKAASASANQRKQRWHGVAWLENQRLAQSSNGVAAKKITSISKRRNSW